jgi:hypothetical protein
MTISDVPISAATAIHKFAIPRNTKTIKADLMIREKAMLVFIVERVLRAR